MHVNKQLHPTNGHIEPHVHPQAAAPNLKGPIDKRGPKPNHYLTGLWAASQADGPVSCHNTGYL